MDPRLEELRRRLLVPSLPSTQSRDTIFGNNSQPSSKPPSSEQPALTDRTKSAESGDVSFAEGSAPVESPAEQAVAERDREIAVDDAASDDLGQAIDKLFEPVRRCADFLAEMTKASDVFLQTTRSALPAFKSLEDFRNHMRKLSNSFASVRTLQNDLGILAESFDPVRALHREVVRLSDDVRIRLATVARSLEPINALRTNVVEIALILEDATALQAQFYDLSKTFVPAFHATATGVSGEPDETV
jgi:hypothetical protein